MADGVTVGAAVLLFHFGVLVGLGVGCHHVTSQCTSTGTYWYVFDHIMLEAGLFESKIRIRYACVHLGRFTKEISSSH
jgi:hypothetical protein